MKTVLEWLKKTAALYPNKPAFEDENTTISWREMLLVSRQIGTALSHRTPPRTPVAVYMDKRPLTVAAMLGVLWAGCYYTIIDRAMPQARVRLIMDIFRPAAVLCEAGDEARFLDAPCLSIEEIAQEVDESRLNAIYQDVIDTDLMYVLFTSGSTGVPKGVSIRHASVLDFGAWIEKTLNLDATCRLGNQAPLYFDNSVLDICSALKTGACVHFIPAKYFLFPRKMIDYIELWSLNTLFWVPSALSALANAGVVQGGRPSGVKRVFFCGETMPCKQLNVWRKSLPDADYVNMYGPTEITDVCAWYRVNRAFSDDDSLPIGFPCDNTRILLIEGEICVAGTCLAAGYYHAAEKTAQAFIQNPMQDAIPERIYKTGDFGAYNEFGELMFLGRRDNQVKRHGYRIEIGEIDTALNACAGVESGCCLYDANNSQIIAFYTGNVMEKDVKAFLRTALSKYMLPDAYDRLEEMPHLGNGKIDRQTLMQKSRL